MTWSSGGIRKGGRRHIITLLGKNNTKKISIKSNYDNIKPRDTRTVF